MFEVTLEAGDCIFLPAWWWIQSNSLADVPSLLVEMEFEAHSQMFDIINEGIELDIILADENEQDSMWRLDKIEKKLKRD